MTLNRPARPRALISLVPMIDVMLILLVFFMVTSTYLNLDMIPAVNPSEGAAAGSPQTPAGTLMIRLGADGVPVLRGTALDSETLQSALSAAVAEEPLTQVVILPSGAARTQALITVMDAAALAGVTRLRVLRLEAAP
ncbi:biopolymer transporter ExbD (plasmid) [Leisingera sp. S132]|uniref:ExbD/TolR family protein n=1 Tax=Leisingera sp. S132 TaxID=2867016 RepID=UPI0021A2693C|nr:biopolymer transporter ExbD [Leisingera sp. S132]UWQ81377.1 biopolymer transporter ExbD [Leisingera sp. S132]